MPLSDTGLVVRYYLDEAASGDPATIQDASANNYDLTATGTDVAANMEHTEVSGNRGVECISTTGNQRLVRAIDDTSDAVRDAMAGVQKATIEVVMDMDAATTNGSRIFGINGRAGQNGEFILKATSTTAYSGTWNDAQAGATFNPGSTVRMVLHFIIDTTEATAGNRVKWAINGGTLNAIGGTNTPALNATLAIAASQDLIAFNRESSGSFDRSWDGILYYAAMYNVAFDQTRVTDHFDVLTADDDTPAAATGWGHLLSASRNRLVNVPR